jgi:tRNA(fMet)-specific endonuclease VapC
MYLLDTNICIYIIKRKPLEVLRILKKKSPKEIFISSITVAELEYGVAKSLYPEKNKVALIEFLSLFNIVNFDDRDAVEFGVIKSKLEKSGKIIGPKDLLLSAQAKSRKLTLVTNNSREFERIEGLRIENWVGGSYGKTKGLDP